MFSILMADTVLHTRGCFACILFLQMHTIGMNQALLGARDPIMQLRVGGRALPVHAFQQGHCSVNIYSILVGLRSVPNCLVTLTGCTMPCSTKGLEVHKPDFF